MPRARKPPKVPGFQVAGTSLFFPLVGPDKFKQGDVPLIEAVTGKDWEAWIRLVQKHGLNHKLVLQGYFAVALQRANNLDPERVVEFVQDLPLVNGIELVFPEEPKQADDANPPAEGDATED